MLNVEICAYHSQWYPKYKGGYPAIYEALFKEVAAMPATDYANARQK
ncbi:MAG TPA: hypothetical protein VF899_20055 [Pyrinomonadaceae bacterium]